MDDWKEFIGKTVDEALTEALLQLQTTSDKVEYEVIEKEAKGFLGLKSRPAKIRVKLKMTIEGSARSFLEKVLKAMNIKADMDIVYDEVDGVVSVNLIGEDMGVLIGKRGQTLDSLQYLTNLVVNKYTEDYLKVKLDTENYRERRKETLENLARNIASKVKRTRKPVALEPMNPYERRIIHYTLQNDRYVETHSEGEEPYRKVVITMKKGVREYNNGYNSYNNNYSNGYNNGYNNGYRSHYDNNGPKKYTKREFHKKYGGNTKDYSTDYKRDYAAYLEQKAAANAGSTENIENRSAAE